MFQFVEKVLGPHMAQEREHLSLPSDVIWAVHLGCFCSSLVQLCAQEAGGASHKGCLSLVDVQYATATRCVCQRSIQT